jgi:hypothetical protein
VVGFAEEEGQRYKATFLGSGALTGHFNPAWLDQTDADGVTMRQAMHQAGHQHQGPRERRAEGLRHGKHRAQHNQAARHRGFNDAKAKPDPASQAKRNAARHTN